MPKKQKRHSAEFKPNVSLEAVKGGVNLTTAGQRLSGVFDSYHHVKIADQPSSQPA